MNEKLRAHVEKLFSNAPQTKRAVELKEELLSNLMDKYNDLIAQGKSEQDALDTVIDGIGDVNELIRGLKASDVMDYGQEQAQRRKTALVVTTAVALIIFSVILLILGIAALGINPIVMVCIMLAIMLGAICMMIFHFMSRPKYSRADDTIVEEFKEWKSQSTQRVKIRKSISSILWTLTTAIYLLISFTLGIWAFSWIIFIIAAFVDRIITLLYQLKEEKNE